MMESIPFMTLMITYTNNINLYEVRDAFNDQLYEIRANRGNNIDFSKVFSTIKRLTTYG